MNPKHENNINGSFTRSGYLLKFSLLISLRQNHLTAERAGDGNRKAMRNRKFLFYISENRLFTTPRFLFYAPRVACHRPQKCLRGDVMVMGRMVGRARKKDQHQVSIEMWMENVRRINIACVSRVCWGEVLSVVGSAARTRTFTRRKRYKIYLLEFHRTENPARTKVNFRYLFLLSNLHRALALNSSTLILSE